MLMSIRSPVFRYSPSLGHRICARTLRPHAHLQGTLRGMRPRLLIATGPALHLFRSTSFTAGAGLFQHPELNQPKGFDRATKSALREAAELVDEISRLSDDPSVEVIQKFDDLSDVLCKVADLAECIRQVHPSPAMAQQAQEACVTINSYVEELNTNTSLHRALRCIMESNQFASLDEITRRTAESFMHDFEISGIHLEEGARREAVDLHNRILELNHQFLQMSSQPAVIEKRGCPQFLLDKFSSHNNHLLITHIPFSSPNAKLRALSYILFYGIFPAQQETLERLLSLRHQLATLVGYPTFSHRVLKSSMAETPETVSQFLDSLNDKILPLAKEEAKEMLALKVEQGDQVDPGVLRPWDITFVSNLAQGSCFPDRLEGIEEYFSIDACLEGLGTLFKSLFGVEVKQIPVTEGEVWDRSVIKLAFIDKSGDLLGYTYCDLYGRNGKTTDDCHFTIQGGRELKDGSYQIPIITLCCSFHPTWSGQLALLSHRMTENLFHEMGHALHSMLGRPKYQNVTGTRCSTDFAEVPSILMEYFLSDSRVLASFAKHCKTGEPLPDDLRIGFQISQGFFPAFDTQMQILYAKMDQRFHGNHPLGKSTVEIFSDLHQKYSPIAYVPQTAWFLRFSHLYGYAAKYYSYLWSRAVACLIWKTCFESDPFSNEVGARYREMLRYGGGVHPRTLMQQFLGFEPTVDDLVEALYSDIARQQKRICGLKNMK